MDEIDQVPSPWKTLRVFTRRATVGLMISAAVWGAWYGYAEWRVHQKLAEYRARGEFASVEELNDPPGDARDDAYVWMEKAAGELKYSPGEDREWEEALQDTPWTNVGRAYVRQLVTNHHGALEYLHRAAVARTAAVRSSSLRSDAYGIDSATVRAHALVVDFCIDAALIEHGDGDDAAAIACLRDGQKIAEIDFRLPGGLGFLQGTKFDAEITQAYVEIAPSLRIQQPMNMRGMARAVVDSLIHHLTDIQPLQDNLLRSFRGQRMIVWNYAQRFDDGSVILRPAALLGVVRQCNTIDDEIVAIGSRLRPFSAVTGKPCLPSSWTGSNLDSLLYASDGPFISDYGYFVQTYYECVMEREAAASLLALRLYAVDHAGRFPVGWKEMVPAYLPAVPVDWFSPTGSPLMYVPERHVFYSVGSNGVDDGGAMTPDMPEMHWREPDAVFSMDPPSDSAMR